MNRECPPHALFAVPRDPLGRMVEWWEVSETGAGRVLQPQLSRSVYLVSRLAVRTKQSRDAESGYRSRFGPSLNRDFDVAAEHQ